MKAIITFVFFIFIATTATANTNVVKVETVAKGVNLEVVVNTAEVNKTSVARLYKFKNTRIKKALNFRTKANKAKMA